MKVSKVQQIESALDVKLPSAYRDFLANRRKDNTVDETTVTDEAEVIIEATLEYRKGFVDLPKWSASEVYIGDESDACPYVLDCESGRVVRLDKGNRERKPLQEWLSFEDFLRQMESALFEETSPAEQRKNALFNYVPLVIGLLVFFVVLPLIGFGLTTLFKWLFR